MHQMELREMLEEVKFADDTDTALDNAQQVLTQEYQEHLAQMTLQLQENNAASNALACDNLRKLKFYQKLNIEIERIEESLFDD